MPNKLPLAKDLRSLFIALKKQIGDDYRSSSEEALPSMDVTEASMKILPTLSQLPAWTTKGDLIAQVDPQVPYDIALPQDWVNHTIKLGFDPRGQVVWAYPHGYVFGLPMPLTEEARRHLAELKQATWEDPA